MVGRKNKIGIIIIATNAYFVLGVRFIKRFMYYHSGDENIKFYFFSDQDPAPVLDQNYDVEYIHKTHKSWVDATNSKFENILTLYNSDCDYLYYFDADTNVDKPFSCDWFLGELVGGEHFANRDWMKTIKGFDRNPKSKAYVPEDTRLFQMYYYGAFFGGTREYMLQFVQELYSWQLYDKKIPYEPGCNDESYINAYFHYNKPTIIHVEQFVFLISDKGGIGETRDVQLDVTTIYNMLLKNRDILVDIKYGNVITNI